MTNEHTEMMQRITESATQAIQEAIKGAKSFKDLAIENAKEFRVWSYNRSGRGWGERFDNLVDAQEYFNHCVSGPDVKVGLEAIIELEQVVKN